MSLDLEHCSNGSGELRTIATILERPVIDKVVIKVGLEPKPPPKAPERGPAHRAGLAAAAFSRAM